MKDASNTSPEVAAESPPIAVLGIGAIEQHGAHLPVGTDWLAAAALARRVAAVLDAYCLPTLPFSMSACHGPTPGTVWLRPETLAAVLRDLVGALYQQGFRQVLVLNGHGGNFVLEPTIQELNLTNPGLAVLMPPAVLPDEAAGPPIFESADREVHAGESETSIHLYLTPELVRAERADFIPPIGREFLDYAFIPRLSPTGIWGKPTLATADKGRRAFERRVRSVVRWARETFARMGFPDTAEHSSTPTRLPSLASDRPPGQPVLPAGRESRSTNRGSRWFDYRATSVEIGSTLPPLAIIPLATLEQHGPHLPLATDEIIVDAVAREVAGRLGEAAYLLPPFPYGTSMAMKGFGGTVWITADTLMGVVRDLVESLEAQGIRRVVVVNLPGGPTGAPSQPRGNVIVKTAVRQLNYDHPDLDVIWVQPLGAARTALAEVFAAPGDDLHAGEIETSLLRYLRPDLVKDVPGDEVPDVGRELVDFVGFAKLSASGVWGRPGLASAAKGERAFEAAVRATADYVVASLAYLGEAKGKSAAGSSGRDESRPVAGSEDWSTVSIRPYREADREAIRALTTEGFVGVAVEHAIEQRWPETSPLTWDQRKLLDVEADLDRHPETCFVAEEGDQVVVYVTATISVAKSQGHIRDLVVGAPLRGRGVGRRLLQRAIAEFRRRGVRIARIETLGHNRIGAHFYPRLGFELVATQNHYAMVLSDHDDAE